MYEDLISRPKAIKCWTRPEQEITFHAVVRGNLHPDRMRKLISQFAATAQRENKLALALHTHRKHGASPDTRALSDHPLESTSRTHELRGNNWVHDSIPECLQGFDRASN
jgi:hypothetical protein